MTPELAADLLGVGPGASRAEIDRQFRKRARASHPDLFAHSSPAAIAAATTEFVRMSAARDTLHADLDRLGAAVPAEPAAPAAPAEPAAHTQPPARAEPAAPAAPASPQGRPRENPRPQSGPRSAWITRGPNDPFVQRMPAVPHPGEPASRQRESRQRDPQQPDAQHPASQQRESQPRDSQPTAPAAGRSSERPLTFAEFVLDRDSRSWIPYQEPTPRPGRRG